MAYAKNVHIHLIGYDQSCVPILKENTIHKPIDFNAHFYREAELTKQIDAQKIEMKLQCERYEKKIQVRFQY